MAQIDKIILNGTQYDLPSGGGGGGTSYTAGAGIDITGNVISNTREQRVLIDEDDDTGLHSGFIVKSPHYRYSNGDYNFNEWSRIFANNIPVENANPYVQSGFFVNNRMKITLKDIQVDGSYTPAWATETIYGYMTINGTTVNSGEKITITSDGNADYTLKTGDVIVVDSSSFGNVISLFDQELQTGYVLYTSIVNIDNYQWTTTNSAYVVHNGAETQLADSSSVTTLVNNSIGTLYAGTSASSYSSANKFSRNKRLIWPDSTVSVTTSGSGSNIADVVTVNNKLTKTDTNLTIAFDNTYQEQQTVTYYAYSDQIDPYYFFGDGVYGGQWYGSANTFVDVLNGEYYINIPLDNISTNLNYGNNLMVYATTDIGEKQMYLTIYNNQLKVATVNGYDVYDSMSGNNFQLNQCVAFVVNGTKITVGDYEYDKVLLSDVSNLTSLGIMPTATGNSYFSNYGWNPYIQTSSQPSYFAYRENTLWPYESSGTVTVQYQNHPEKLNHYIRYAGETGTAVGNRKAYIITDKNISQSSVISGLDTRVTALEQGGGGGGGGGITGITMNGSSVTVTAGVADLGTVITSLSNYYTKSEIDAMIGNISSALDAINGETV